LQSCLDLGDTEFSLTSPGILTSVAPLSVFVVYDKY
jgi:hypothetical protein